VVFRRRQRPVGEDAYLGERVTVTGRLMVSGDLDIGDDVTIEEGFEANGWIVIRNPVPTLVFYFIVPLSPAARRDRRGRQPGGGARRRRRRA